MNEERTALFIKSLVKLAPAFWNDSMHSPNTATDAIKGAPRT